MLRARHIVAIVLTIFFISITCTHIFGAASNPYFSPSSIITTHPQSHTSNTMADTVTHTVLFQIKADANPDAVKAALDGMLALQQSCLHPTTQKPYILSLKGGKDNSPEGLQNGITHAFVVEFPTIQDRDYYVSKDPAHQAFIQTIGGLVEKVIVVDFSSGVF